MRNQLERRRSRRHAADPVRLHRALRQDDPRGRASSTSTGTAISTPAMGEARGMQPGVKIVLASGNGPAQTLYYFRTDVSNGGVAASGFLKFAATLGNGNGLLKSASYLMHSGNFTQVRDFVLSHSQQIVQDDFGHSVRRVPAGRLDLPAVRRLSRTDRRLPRPRSAAARRTVQEGKGAAARLRHRLSPPRARFESAAGRAQGPVEARLAAGQPVRSAARDDDIEHATGAASEHTECSTAARRIGRRRQGAAVAREAGIARLRAGCRRRLPPRIHATPRMAGGSSGRFTLRVTSASRPTPRRRCCALACDRR